MQSKLVAFHFQFRLTYWQGKIISPNDEGISDAIKTNLEPTVLDTTCLLTSPLLLDKTREMSDAYFTSLDSFNTHKYEYFPAFEFGL